MAERRRGQYSKKFEWEEKENECRFEFRYSLGIDAAMNLTKNEEDGLWDIHEIRFDCASNNDYTEIYHGKLSKEEAMKKAEEQAGYIIDFFDRMINGVDALADVEAAIKE